jgi:hypothetical protein
LYVYPLLFSICPSHHLVSKLFINTFVMLPQDIGQPNFDEFGDNNGIGGGDGADLMDTSSWPTFGAHDTPPEHTIMVHPPPSSTDSQQQHQQSQQQQQPQQQQQQQQHQQPPPQQQQQQARNNSTGGQVPGLGLYRRQSQRNPRSCDVCRGRKTVCRVEGSLPCVTCRSLRRECTFTERTRKKRKTDSQAKAQANRNQDGESTQFLGAPPPCLHGGKFGV